MRGAYTAVSILSLLNHWGIRKLSRNGVQGMPAEDTVDTREWMSKNSEEVIRIVRYKFRFFDPDKYRDVAQYTCLRMCQVDSLSKFDPKQASFRVYLYTIVIRFVLSYLSRNVSKELPNTQLLPETHRDANEWYRESDTKIDADAVTAWVQKYATPAQVRVFTMLMAGKRVTDVAMELNMSKQAVDQHMKAVVANARKRFVGVPA